MGKPLLAVGCALAFLIATPAAAQLEIHNEEIAVRFGFHGQMWADWTRDPGATGYQQNLYFRRVRLMMGGSLGENISFFFQTDAPNLGKTPKAMNSGFLIQDAYIEWRVNNALQISGGEMFAPHSRQQMQSPSSYYSLDISPVAAVNNAPTGSSALRDLGFAARGFFLHDRLQYRMGIFQGQREANARNALRTAAYLQYDFFEPEKGYAYVGTALGKKKILAVDAGVDKQGAYRAYTANVASDTPVRGGDEVGLNVQYLHFDGRQKFPTLPAQNNVLVEAAYYLRGAHLQPFGRAESQAFVTEADHCRDVRRWGGGVNYYIHGQNLKWTAQYLRLSPETQSGLRAGNQLTVQLQFFYY